ncbi:MAG: preprotein translocase subunit SecE [Bacteroidia bacterium]|jgi:preprotein translocase subunit SecE|nr:preprotein translocase subunit SecE [Bacteroidia bacterium]
MEKVIAYLKSTSEELMTKVSWPTWEELQSSTIIVMVASIIFAGVVFIIDFTSNFAMEIFYKFFEN